MLRRGALIIAAAAVVVGVVAVFAGTASAGGGCHGTATQGTGDTVRLQEMCPSPTIVRVAPGDTVTFVNEDPTVHNVIGLGLQWGHPEDLQQGDSFSETFTEPGVYPYACWYHWGMVGAVVVGDGTGAGNGATVELAAASPSPVAVVADASPTERGSSATTGWLAGGGIGLVLGGLAGTLVRRRRTARS